MATTELGKVRWLRDYDVAVKEAKSKNKYIFILFQEVPGCSTCTGYGSKVLSDDKVVKLIHENFVPLCIHNNAGGADKRVLDSFGEAAWNNPVVRIVDHERNDIAKVAGDYSAKGTLAAIEKAMKKHASA